MLPLLLGFIACPVGLAVVVSKGVLAQIPPLTFGDSPYSIYGHVGISRNISKPFSGTAASGRVMRARVCV